MALFRGWFVQRDGSNNGTSPKGGRLALAGLLSKATGGVVGTGVLVDGMTPVVSGSGAGMTYNVRACAVVAKHSDANGPTISALDATENIALADDGSSLAAPGSNSRRDVIYAVQDLVTADGGTGTVNTFRVAVRKGDPAASPATPSVADVSGAVPLAYATVPSGTANTSGLVFTQLHSWRTANGGLVPTAKGSREFKVWNGTEELALFGSTSVQARQNILPSGGLWTSNLNITQVPSPDGFQMSMRGRLVRTGPGFALGGSWTGIGTVTVPTSMRPNVSGEPTDIPAIGLRNGHTPFAITINTATGSMAIRSEQAVLNWVTGDFFDVVASPWTRTV